jgi:hypothetical protein
MRDRFAQDDLVQRPPRRCTSGVAGAQARGDCANAATQYSALIAAALLVVIVSVSLIGRNSAKTHLNIARKIGMFDGADAGSGEASGRSTDSGAGGD